MNKFGPPDNSSLHINFKSKLNENYLELVNWNHKEISEFFQIKSHHNILDMGCGYGRLAVPLIKILSSGSYLGIELRKEPIDWANETFKEKQNINFKYIDLFSQFFNPEGKVKVLENQELFGNSGDIKFDLIIFHSVFTHLLKSSIDQYLDLIEEGLNDCNFSGSIVTMYLFSEKDRCSGSLKTASLPFVDNGEDIIFEFPDNPEFTVAIQKEWFDYELTKRNLHIENIKYGSWINSLENNGCRDGQDLVFIKKGTK